MWSLLVVCKFPPVSDFPYLIQVAKQVQIKDLVSIGFVKAFDKRVLVRFAGLNILNCHPDLFSPGDKLTTEKFGAVVSP